MILQLFKILFLYFLIKTKVMMNKFLPHRHFDLTFSTFFTVPECLKQTYSVILSKIMYICKVLPLSFSFTVQYSITEHSDYVRYISHPVLLFLLLRQSSQLASFSTTPSASTAPSEARNSCCVT